MGCGPGQRLCNGWSPSTSQGAAVTLRCPYLGRQLGPTSQATAGLPPVPWNYCSPRTGFFGLVSSSLFLMECWVAILQEGWASCIPQAECQGPEPTVASLRFRLGSCPKPPLLSLLRAFSPRSPCPRLGKVRETPLVVTPDRVALIHLGHCAGILGDNPCPIFGDQGIGQG